MANPPHYLWSSMKHNCGNHCKFANKRSTIILGEHFHMYVCVCAICSSYAYFMISNIIFRSPAEAPHLSPEQPIITLELSKILWLPISLAALRLSPSSLDLLLWSPQTLLSNALNDTTLISSEWYLDHYHLFNSQPISFLMTITSI